MSTKKGKVDSVTARIAEFWAQAASVRFLGSFEAEIPAIAPSASQLEFEQAVTDAAMAHFGEMVEDQEFRLPGFLPQYQDEVKSVVSFDGMQIDWDYVDGAAQMYSPSWDDDIPAALEYTVIASYRHELTPEEDALPEPVLDQMMILRAEQLSAVLTADMASAAGFMPEGEAEADDCGYDWIEG